MNIFLTVVSLAGLYFLLHMLPFLHQTAFMAGGYAISWFMLSFAAGSIVILKVCLGK